MLNEEKKAFLLLKSVIFHYHGLDEEEQRILDATAKKLNAEGELEWANNFIAEDFYSAFERARKHMNVVFKDTDKNELLSYLDQVWKANNQKGYITEMEATAMLKIAKDWKIENELISKIRS